MHLPHPLAVALGKVVVDGDDVDAVARQGVEVAGQHGDEGLAFAGLHLRDAALVQYDAADELHGVGLHPQHAPGRLAGSGEGLRQQIVQRLPRFQTVLEALRLRAKLRVAQRGVLALHADDAVHDGADLFQLPVGIGPENFIQ